MAKGKIDLKVSKTKSPVAYLSLPGHPGEGTPGCVKKTVRLSDLCGSYGGPDVYLDYDIDNTLIGIEILV